MEDDFLDSVAADPTSDESIRNEKPSEFGIRLKIENFSKIPIDEKIYSPPCIFHNLAWRIMIQRNEKAGKSRLGYFLVCDPDSTKVNGSWTCEASARMYIINQEEDNDHHFSRRIRHLFCAEENDWGYIAFCQWDYICDPTNKYILNDAVKFDICVIVDRPENIDLSYNNFFNVKQPTKPLKSAEKIENENAKPLESAEKIENENAKLLAFKDAKRIQIEYAKLVTRSTPQKIETKNVSPLSENNDAVATSIQRVKNDIMKEVDTMAANIQSEMKQLKVDLLESITEQLRKAFDEINARHAIVEAEKETLVHPGSAMYVPSQTPVESEIEHAPAVSQLGIGSTVHWFGPNKILTVLEYVNDTDERRVEKTTECEIGGKVQNNLNNSRGTVFEGDSEISDTSGDDFEIISIDEGDEFGFASHKKSNTSFGTVSKNADNQKSNTAKDNVKTNRMNVVGAINTIGISDESEEEID